MKSRIMDIKPPAPLVWLRYRSVGTILGCMFSLLMLLNQCRPTEEIAAQEKNTTLIFSTDSLLFDTLFTQQVSISRRLKVINPLEEAITISSIRLGGMNQSSYSLIINGQKSNQITNFFLRGKDSILILANVLLDRKNLDLPFLVQDSILFSTGSVSQAVYLTAWGRDAEYYRGDTLPNGTVWDNISARFIYKSVFVPAGATLRITKGTMINAEKNAGIVVAGTLIVEGDTGKANKVTFQGPRLDSYWADIPGQWQGITFLPGSVNNIINWAEIKNAADGIRMGSSDNNTDQTQLKITNSIIKNMSGRGIIAYSSALTSWNCLITNCADYCLAGLYGGTHTHYNNTIANYDFTFRRTVASAIFSDDTDGANDKNSLLSLTLINNIFWGSRPTELTLRNFGSANWIAPTLSNNIMRSDKDPSPGNNNLVFNFLNTDRMYRRYLDTLHFTDEQNANFSIDSTSAAVNKGQTLNFFTTDLRAKERKAAFDLGAYEH